jgi:Putative restriction endonuclease
MRCGKRARSGSASSSCHTECPLSTSDGVKAIDVAWLAPERRQEVRSVSCLVRAPEICVEVLSPSNTPEEMSEKIALYFESGAREVWICEQELSSSLLRHPAGSPIVGDVSGFPAAHQRLNPGDRKGVYKQRSKNPPEKRSFFRTGCYWARH